MELKLVVIPADTTIRQRAIDETGGKEEKPNNKEFDSQEIPRKQTAKHSSSGNIPAQKVVERHRKSHQGARVTRKRRNRHLKGRRAEQLCP